MIEAPIPGESLTTEPRNASWESTPKTADPEEALYYHLERLTDPVRLSAIMNVLEQGSSVQELTEAIVRSGVAQGIHSIDISLMVAPVIHEYIKGQADNVGIEYDEGPDFKEIDVIEMNKQVGKRSAKMPQTLAKTQIEPQEKQAPVEEEAPAPQESKGLMSRPEGM